jgi:signal transduction histidine kinase
LWMTCLAGVFRVRKQDFEDFDRGAISGVRCAAYNKSDGMASAQCNGVSKPAGWKGKDGRLWFPTTRGVVVVDPKSIRESETPPPVVIENVTSGRWQATGFPAPAVGKENPVARNLSPITIPPGRGELEFHYTALSFIAPERNRFKYRLEGIDSDWVDAGTRRIAHYNNIRPGAYTFRVSGCNSDGIWNQAGASVAIFLAPHFWQTGWFVGLSTLAAIGLVAGTARYFTWQRVQHRLQRLEQQHAVERERARIARDMHDDLGARLTEVLLVNDQVKKCKTRPDEVETQISKASRAVNEVIDNLHGIVWAVNPKNDSLEKLAGYICQYGQTFLESTSTRFRFDAPEKLPDVAVSSEVRHNVFMVVKESLNNVVKYAASTEVWLRLRLENSMLNISIEDNGQGFSVEEKSSQGNGLQNMQKRAVQMGGTFLVSSEPGKGTRIQLRIPMRAVSKIL